MRGTRLDVALFAMPSEILDSLSIPSSQTTLLNPLESTVTLAFISKSAFSDSAVTICNKLAGVFFFLVKVSEQQVRPVRISSSDRQTYVKNNTNTVTGTKKARYRRANPIHPPNRHVNLKKLARTIALNIS